MSADLLSEIARLRRDLARIQGELDRLQARVQQTEGAPLTSRHTLPLMAAVKEPLSAPVAIAPQHVVTITGDRETWGDLSERRVASNAPTMDKLHSVQPSQAPAPSQAPTTSTSGSVAPKQTTPSSGTSRPLPREHRPISEPLSASNAEDSVYAPKPSRGGKTAIVKGNSERPSSSKSSAPPPTPTPAPRSRRVSEVVSKSQPPGSDPGGRYTFVREDAPKKRKGE